MHALPYSELKSPSAGPTPLSQCLSAVLQAPQPLDPDRVQSTLELAGLIVICSAPEPGKDSAPVTAVTMLVSLQQMLQALQMLHAARQALEYFQGECRGCRPACSGPFYGAAQVCGKPCICMHHGFDLLCVSLARAPLSEGLCSGRCLGGPSQPGPSSILSSHPRLQACLSRTGTALTQALVQRKQPCTRLQMPVLPVKSALGATWASSWLCWGSSRWVLRGLPHSP